MFNTKLSPTPISVKGERLHALDAVRAFALLLGIFYHATISFYPGWVPWPMMDTQRAAGLSSAGYVSHIFRMSTFFLLAGFFGRMVQHRIGTPSFAKQRLKRIGIPLIIGWPVLFTCMITVFIWAFSVQNGGVIPEGSPPPPALTLKTLPLTHLWFLYVLGILYAVMLILRTFLSKIDRNNVLARGTDTIIARLISTPLLPILLALPITIALLMNSKWYGWWGIPTPDTGIVPNIYAMIAYGTAFTFGWVLHRQPKLIQKFEHLWVFYTIAAIILTAICLHILGNTPVYDIIEQNRDGVIYTASYSLAVWCWTFAFIGTALKFLSGHSPIRRYLADASYWLYLIHLPIIMAAQVFVSQWDMNPYLKYTIIMGTTLPIMLISYHVLVRYTFIGAVLNGKKHPRKPKAK